MYRRQYVSTAATAGLAAAAGCSFADGPGTDDGGEDDATGSGSADADENGADGGEGEGDGADTAARGSDDEPTELASLRTVEDRYDPDAVRFDGARHGRSGEFALDDGLTVVTFDHVGGTEFVVELLDEDGTRVATIAEADGAIEGARALPTVAGEYSLAVRSAGGSWVLRAAQPRAPAAAVRRPPAAASGTGPDVVGPAELDGTATVSAAHGGESAFGLTLYPEDATAAADAVAVFEGIGPFEGDVPVGFDATAVRFDGIAWIAVAADGGWSLAIESATDR